MKYYCSPRWTGEILDCSLPVTLDTYNKCSYNCLYCFSYYQKSHTIGATNKERKEGNIDYQSSNVDVTYVDKRNIQKLLSLDPTSGQGSKQFFDFIKNKKVIQWGGLADQFDMYEKKFGKTLELLEIFKKYNYPLCFSTKGIWWIYDERYRRLFKDQDNWNTKISIINLDERRAKLMEKGVQSPMDRLKAMKELSKLNKGGVTLRLRPFILGFSDKNNEHLELLKLAKANGATAVSTEFFCLEARANEALKDRYRQMSELIGFDIYDFYKKHSQGAGYRRLNYNIKSKTFSDMEDMCKKLGLRFYVSDAHHKEKCHNGSCCGLSEEWNYSRGQFTEALIIAKRKGKVYFSDIEEHLEQYKKFMWGRALGFNTYGTFARAKRAKQTMYDFIREIWNTPNSEKSPYKYFGGKLMPIGVDKQKNVVYAYKGE